VIVNQSDHRDRLGVLAVGSAARWRSWTAERPWAGHGTGGALISGRSPRGATPVVFGRRRAVPQRTAAHRNATHREERFLNSSLDPSEWKPFNWSKTKQGLLAVADRFSDAHPQKHNIL